MSQVRYRVGSGLLAWFFAAALATPAALATDDSPLLDSLRKRFQTRSLRLGLVVQSLATFGSKGTVPGLQDGFAVGDTRLNVQGELDGKLRYFVQFQPNHDVSLLDSVLIWQAGRVGPPSAGWPLTLSIGQFKAPFSLEALTASPNTDLINRAQVVTSLAPGRQVGAQVRLVSRDRQHEAMAGAFNGNGTNTTNNNDDLLYVARVRSRVLTWGLGPASAGGLGPASAGGRGSGSPRGWLTLGGSWAQSKDLNLDITGLAPSPAVLVAGQYLFTGTRELTGLELTSECGPWGVKGEWIRGAFRPASGLEFESDGWFAQVHRWVRPGCLQVIYRYDTFHVGAGAPDHAFHILAFNYAASEVVSVSVVYAQAEDPGDTGVGLADNMFQCQFQLVF